MEQLVAFATEETSRNYRPRRRIVFPASWTTRLQQPAQRLHLRHRRFAGEILTKVNCRLAIDRSHRANRFVFFGEKILTLGSISQQNGRMRQKMLLHFL